MSNVDLTAKIPNNVALGDDKKLLRALTLYGQPTRPKFDWNRT